MDDAITGMREGAPLGSAFTLIRAVGSGTVGTVWAVSRKGSWALYAAKFLKPEYHKDSEFLERFVRERTVLSQLHHQYIVPIEDMVVEGDNLAIVMEYQHGGSVREFLQKQKNLLPGEAFGIVERVLLALEYAHRSGVLHLDIKPDNVLLSGHYGDALVEQVRVADFGIATLMGQTESQGFYGTPAYMSPERKAYGSSDSSADIYSAGVMLHELLVGAVPLVDADSAVQISDHLPEDVRTVLENLMSLSPKNRPQAAQAVAQVRALRKKYQDADRFEYEERASENQSTGGRQRTVIRGGEQAPAQAAQDNYSTQVPELGEASHQTIIRPVTEAPVVEEEEIDEEFENEQPRTVASQLKRPLVWGSILGILALICACVFVFINSSGEKKQEGPKEHWTASSGTNSPLPSGLGTRLEADYDPSSHAATVKFEYSTQKSGLHGDILQVIPGLSTDSCPQTTWNQASEAEEIRKNQAAITGLDTKCAWNVSNLKIPANSAVTMSAKVDIDIPDQKSLEKWLGEITKKTQTAISDPDVKSASYPIQRIQKIEVQVPNRVVNQSAVPVTLLPVWPSGKDDLNPLMKLPQTGTPSQAITSLAPDTGDIAFTDGCSGHLSISADQKNVTALSVAPQCKLNVQVGNFTNLQSNAFSITSR
ncbi:serine/threonine-protein kinase [Rothia dentocariosa]|uniref:serine/threonine-protein kinase n=1 Tax=Rothia dentocariosa TaxID=2047 RepID=UPI00399F3F44